MSQAYFDHNQADPPEWFTDLDNHHIEGMAHADVRRRQFKIPLISHVEGNLWQGGCINRVKLPDDFKYVVSLYPWEKYDLPEGCKRLEITMYDAGEMPDITQLHEIAEAVCNFKKQGKTLVHCQAGLNRSGLVAALSLIKCGKTPAEAIGLLRSSRSEVVLCNQVFENWLMGLSG